MSDVLKKPVHAVILKPTHVRELYEQGKLPTTLVSVPPMEYVKLPQAEKVKKPRFSPFKQFNSVGKNVHKKELLKAKLTVLHNSVPPFEKDRIPPCDTCSGAPCCKVFVVSLTPDEYASGLYEPYSIKLTKEVTDQLNGKLLLPITLTLPAYDSSESIYLEGRIGDPCPFLDENNKCTIYEHRPIVCRTYSCVGDDRITDELRNTDDRGKTL